LTTNYLSSYDDLRPPGAEHGLAGVFEIRSTTTVASSLPFSTASRETKHAKKVVLGWVLYGLDGDSGLWIVWYE
jgi:hypothetical protein